MAFLTLSQVNGLGGLASAHKWSATFTIPTTGAWSELSTDEKGRLELLLSDVTLPSVQGSVRETKFRGFTHRQYENPTNGGTISINFVEDENGDVVSFFRQFEKLQTLQEDLSQKIEQGGITLTIKQYKNDSKTILHTYTYYNVGLSTYTAGTLSAEQGAMTGSAELYFSHFDYVKGDGTTIEDTGVADTYSGD